MYTFRHSWHGDARVSLVHSREELRVQGWSLVLIVLREQFIDFIVYLGALVVLLAHNNVSHVAYDSLVDLVMTYTAGIHLNICS